MTNGDLHIHDQAFRKWAGLRGDIVDKSPTDAIREAWSNGELVDQENHKFSSSAEVRYDEDYDIFIVRKGDEIVEVYDGTSPRAERPIGRSTRAEKEDREAVETTKDIPQDKRDEFKELRKRVGLTQTQLSKRISPSEGRISEFERGLKDMPMKSYNAAMNLFRRMIREEGIEEEEEVEVTQEQRDKIRRMRNEADLTLREVGDKVGRSLSYIGKFERGEIDITMDTLRDIMNAITEEEEEPEKEEDEDEQEEIQLPDIRVSQHAKDQWAMRRQGQGLAPFLDTKFSLEETIKRAWARGERLPPEEFRYTTEEMRYDSESGMILMQSGGEIDTAIHENTARRPIDISPEVMMIATADIGDWKNVVMEEFMYQEGMIEVVASANSIEDKGVVKVEVFKGDIASTVEYEILPTLSDAVERLIEIVSENSPQHYIEESRK